MSGGRRRLPMGLTGALGLIWFVAAAQAPKTIDRAAWMRSSPSTPLPILKPMPASSRTYPNARDFMRVLERFPLYGERGWRTPAVSGHPIGFFGDPEHAEMGLRSMGNVVFVYALLSTDPLYDPKPSGVDSARLLARARECLEYMTRAHVTGDLTCGDGRKWGDHWQSAWWTAKMALGARLIWPMLTENERTRVERVVVHEADRHLSRQAPGGALSNTRSEENAWDVEVLAAAMAMFPGHRHANAWKAKLIEFSANTLSAPQDLTSAALLDGRPVRDQVYTTNIHSDYTIENHGAFHTCYMACPLHSFAWSYLALSLSSESAPDALFHHYADVWRRLRPLFLNWRFAYPSGKDWPRYAYGLSFIMPALAALQERYGDRTARYIEARRMRAFELEQRANRDGSFFGARFTRNIMMDRWAEYETDAYANIGAAYLLHRRRGLYPPIIDRRSLDRQLADAHSSPEAGLAYVRYGSTFASMAWRRLEGPVPCAYFLDTAADDLAEWGPGNLLGRIEVAGADRRRAQTVHQDIVTPTSLRSVGTITYLDRAGAPLYAHEIRFEADLKERVGTISSRFSALQDLTVESTEGLRLHVANDFFNGYRRRWRYEGGLYDEVYRPPSVPPEQETLRTVQFSSSWINVDNRIGIRALDRVGPFVLRYSDRQNGAWGSVHYSVLDCPAQDTSRRQYRKGETILNGRYVVILGDSRRTRSWRKSRETTIPL